jgi:hypothetical protein
MFFKIVEGIDCCTYLYKKKAKQVNLVITEEYYLQTSCKILFNILLSKLILFVYKINGDHQSEFQHNTLPTGHIFGIYQILVKEWKYNGTVHQLFIRHVRKPMIPLGQEVL